MKKGDLFYGQMKQAQWSASRYRRLAQEQPALKSYYIGLAESAHDQAAAFLRLPDGYVGGLSGWYHEHPDGTRTFLWEPTVGESSLLPVGSLRRVA